MNGNTTIICRAFACLVPAVATCVAVSCSRRPSASRCEGQAIAALYSLAVAQAAYSYLVEQDDGLPRFATDLHDLYHAKHTDGKPIWRIDRAIVEANSPETAYYCYYFSAIDHDATGSIDPRLDFAICAVPLRDDCRRFVIRGSGGCAYMEHGESIEKAVSKPVESYPDLARGAWLPIGFAGCVEAKKAGAVLGREWPGKWGKLLSREDFETWRKALQERRQRGPAHRPGM